MPAPTNPSAAPVGPAIAFPTRVAATIAPQTIRTESTILITFSKHVWNLAAWLSSSKKPPNLRALVTSYETQGEKTSSYIFSSLPAIYPIASPAIAAPFKFVPYYIPSWFFVKKSWLIPFTLYAVLHAH